MLRREHQGSTGDERAVHLRHQPAQVFDIVEGERAIDQVERRHGQVELLHIGPGVGDRRVLARGPGARQHLFGNIDAQDVSGTLLSCPAAEPAKAAAEVEHVAPAEVGKQSTQCRPFGRTVQALDRTGEPAVSGEKLVIVIDVLRHRFSRSQATRAKVARIRKPASTLPRRVPATFERPARRRPCGTGSSRILSPARAARICISRFQP